MLRFFLIGLKKWNNCLKVMLWRKRGVCLTTLNFQGHALNWRTSLVLQKRRKGLNDIEYWNVLKEALHVRHVPSYYKREFLDKL